MDRKINVIILITVIVLTIFTVTCYAVTDAEVQAVVDSNGKESVSGNLFIWFLCALAFMKVSQKIDSFMNSLGISVGRTGGSMLAETMMAGKAIGSAFKGGGSFAGFGKGGSVSGGSAPVGKAGFFGGIGRKMADGATGSVTGNASGGMMASIGKKMYENSVGKGGAFATGVIGSVARGDINGMGTISGTNGKMAMESYFGYNANVEQSSSVTSNSVGYDSNGEAIDGGFSAIETGNAGESIPTFSDIEMGGGRITGMETSSEYPNGIQFAMYDAEKYAKPEGTFETVTAVDNSKWYKQYAAPTVEKSPYMDTSGKVQYNEKIIERIPKAPMRRDRM